MPREIWEYIAHHGVLSAWNLPSEQRAKLDNGLLKMQTAEVAAGGKVDLPSGLLAGPGIYGQKGIYKFRVNGKQALRVMVCLGPQALDTRWTALATAIKKDNDTSVEKVAAVTATTRMAQLKAGTAKSLLYHPTRKKPT
jgi:hypothetical protein